MKTIKEILTGLMMCATLLTTSTMKAQTTPLPEIKFPELSYQPTIKKGWAGQFVYEVHFDGKSSGKVASYEQYYSVKADCIYSGFIELPTEVRAPIRVNQPEKNNDTRWESWIRSGTGKCSANVDVAIRSFELTGNMANDAITGTLEKSFTYSTSGGWIDGRVNNVDLQIDHTDGKYSFAVPYVSFKLDGTAQRINTTFKPSKKDTVTEKMNPTHDFRDLVYIQPVEWYIIEGEFKTGQQEIEIRRRIPLILQQDVTLKGRVIKLSLAKGYIDYYMRIKKAG